jgi:non-specific serine/threonine protein kinase
MRLLKARNRLAMTGTPIENNTFDLYAQISFLNPGLLGSIKHFKEHFSTPIDNFGDEAASVTLRRMVHPFLLRRTKEQVAKDLPERTETILYCEMEAEQRKLYEALRVQIKEDIENKVSEGGLNKAKFMMLEGLLRLRQLCNATELVDDKLPPKKRQSIKIEVLLEQIKEELGNHKALIFSQFVSMLSLIKKALDKEQIRYAYLDGSTHDRKKAVSDFLDDDDCHLFLISLKAGNTGLNLVKADYVYIVDPWWNPAVEAQAIDRTHRIGQTRNIFAYRLICKDTIEEKIVQLQQKKKKLASDLIQTDENVFKALSKDELMSLFE